MMDEERLRKKLMGLGPMEDIFEVGILREDDD